MENFTFSAEDYWKLDPRYRQELLQRVPLPALNLSARTDGYLRVAGYQTAYELVHAGPEAIRETYGIDETAYREIVKSLRALGPALHDW